MYGTTGKHTAEFQRQNPGISPPKLKEYLNKEVKPVTPPKFLRDTMDVSDIEGASVKKMKRYKTRDIMQYRDIEGAYPKLKHWNFK